jgi:hypothetical protein
MDVFDQESLEVFRCTAQITAWFENRPRKNERFRWWLSLYAFSPATKYGNNQKTRAAEYDGVDARHQQLKKNCFGNGLGYTLVIRVKEVWEKRFMISQNIEDWLLWFLQNP